MMKKILAMVMVCAMMGLQLASVGYAQTTAVGPSGSSSASVPSFLEFSLSQVVKMDPDAGDTDPWTQGTVQTSPSFDFGTLIPVKDPVTNATLYMRGQFYYYVLLLASTSGRKYKITETGTQLVGPGGATIAKESVFMAPDYQWLDKLGTASQLGPPNGAVLGPVASACLTDSLVYQSGTTGDSRIVRAVLAIGGPQAGDTVPANYSLGHNGSAGQGTKQLMSTWKPITGSQKSGDYTGTMTFTLVLN
jgi:hypothetical protein